MAGAVVVARVRSLMRRGRYRLTLHAERERDADRIQIVEVEQALSADSLDVIEDYPDDPRGHSHLVLGFTDSGLPVHAVCAVHEETLVIVTLYRPDPKLWQDYRVRREKK
jgi:hypothetical protein